MSWSITLIGRPEKVCERLKKHSELLKDESKIEFDDALPHIMALVSQNVGDNHVIKLNANGHASFVNRIKTYGNMQIQIDPIYGELAV